MPSDKKAVVTERDAAVLRPDGTASLIRINPNQDTINAVLGAWAYGFIPNGSSVAFWATIDPTAALLVAFDAPMGAGDPNPLAGLVCESITSIKQSFYGDVLMIDQSGDSDNMNGWVGLQADSVTDLRTMNVPVPDYFYDPDDHSHETTHDYCLYIGECVCDEHPDDCKCLSGDTA
ncbi:MAG: hypothetical protein KDB26_08410 [Microthrixaceae bacterium]|nr:hypothetical protein [Microthrixaceae bacterium]